MAKPYKPLKLLAESGEDVTIFSAALQDAIAQIGDFSYEPKSHIFRLVFNRFCGELGQRGAGLRVRSALQIHGVLQAQAKRLKQGLDEGVVSLLSISFEGEADGPGGDMVLTFSGDGQLRLSVECVDMILADISEPWGASSRPKHQIDD
ncbi:DUF2948 family protein [Woodsholea maritima]|uniref:DUF2948 family protein n=1 Tax=Woodsholea maritima TaxID=240237 RepID=UPI00036F5651|nr:DUF2948 family protein [Woodsholea maritima]